MLNVPRQSTLVLTRDAVFDNTWAAVRDNFPLSSTTAIEFYDSTGTVISTIDGTVEARRLVYLETDLDKLNGVPNGAQYELYVNTPTGPYKYEYGQVIRREASFFTPPPSSLEQESRLFVDTLNRDSVGRRWIVTFGGIAMHDLTGAGTRTEGFGMGPALFGLGGQAGMRYFRPMGGDSWRFRFQVFSRVTPFPLDLGHLGLGGDGRFRLHMGCDAMLTTGIGFELDTSATTKLHVGAVTGPIDMTYRTTVTGDLVHDNDEFLCQYSDITKLLQVYRNGNLTTPLITLDDTDGEFAHGPGYRYWGFSWHTGLASSGPLLCTLEAQDYV